eukprot:1009188-Pyramimonas_sp.AAC.1
MFIITGQVRLEDLQTAMAKLHTPRELMICMMEVISRLEGRADKGQEGLLANREDLEIAVNRAKEQAS